jgi:ferric-dicitrate binding protein FerR (iron transport regulator)
MMAKRKKAAQSKAKEAADVARPYVQKLIEDDDLRANLRDAYEAARDAYDRAVDGKGPAKAVLEDKRMQEDLRNAAESLRSASETLREPAKPEKRRGGGLGRLLLVALVAAVLALALSEDLRKALLDRLFGAEEEFEYTSTTAPSSTPAGSA